MPVQSFNRTTPLLSSVTLRRLTEKCLAMIEELQTRDTIRRTLSSVSDRQLRDAGIIRNDIDAACGHSLSHSSASELRAAARGRTGNW
jgi:uncharacterized protein YjiS (DUF1127 family)